LNFYLFLYSSNKLPFIFNLFLFLNNYIILILTCAEISIVMCYFQLCNQDYEWWWRSFLNCGTSALYVFLYFTFHFKIYSNFMNLVFLIIICLFYFILSGTIGCFSCFIFVKCIYSRLLLIINSFDQKI